MVKRLDAYTSSKINGTSKYLTELCLRGTMHSTKIPALKPWGWNNKNSFFFLCCVIAICNSMNL